MKEFLYACMGIVAMFGGFCILRMLYHGILRLVRRLQDRRRLKALRETTGDFDPSQSKF